MRGTITILATVAAALTSTIGMARAADQQRFVHDGSTYVYTSKMVADRQVIAGRRYPSGSAFRLVVRGDRVSGMVGGLPVSFNVARAADATGTKAAIETAAR